MICAGLIDGNTAPAAQLAQQAAHRAVDVGERDFRSNLKFLRLVISTMGELPGQRILIFISPGFLTFSEEAMELKSQLLEIASQANVTINAIDVRGLYTTDLEATNAGGNPGATANKTVYRQKSASLKENVMAELTLRCSPSFGPKFSLIKVDRCLQNIIDRSLLLGLWEL